jgi:nitronate monooxygenase
MWPDRRLIDLLRVPHPILQAPMAGAIDWRLAAAAARGGAGRGGAQRRHA